MSGVCVGGWGGDLCVCVFLSVSLYVCVWGKGWTLQQIKPLLRSLSLLTHLLPFGPRGDRLHMPHARGRCVCCMSTPTSRGYGLDEWKHSSELAHCLTKRIWPVNLLYTRYRFLAHSIGPRPSNTISCVHPQWAGKSFPLVSLQSRTVKWTL